MDGGTDGRTEVQYNPRCACAPRVNNTMQIDDFKTCADQRGISIDADVALWLDKARIQHVPANSNFEILE